MTERSYFFNSTENDKRVYQAEDFARFFEQVLGGYESVGRTGTGVSRFADGSLEAIKAEQTGTDMTVEVTPGYAFIVGKMYYNDATLSLACGTAHPTYDRIDRVVIRLDENTDVRHIRATVKAGVPATNPSPPGLEWSDMVKEISLAQVRIVAGRTYITNDDIMDERADISVCGYLPLHNVYRGQTIDERGIVTLPNQSYVDVQSNNAGYELLHPDDGINVVPLNNTTVDKQNEIYGNSFIPKADGIYSVWLQMRANEGVLQNIGIPSQRTPTVQVIILINGQKDSDFPIFEEYVANYYNNIWTGNQTVALKAGDKLQLMGIRFYFIARDPIPIENIHVRITKIS